MTINNRGFGYILFLCLVPLLTAALTLGFSTIRMFEMDISLKYSCRIQSVNAQKKVAILIKKLFSLNKTALHLRHLKASALKELALAANPVRKISASIKLQKIIEKQKILDLRQKQIIVQGNIILLESFQSTRNFLSSIFRKNNNFLLHHKLISTHGSAPKLAVIPEMDGLAPTYTLPTNFNDAQTLAHAWHYRVHVSQPFHNFLPGEFDVSKSCAVTLTKEGESWRPQIKMAKYLSKSAW